MKNYENNMRDEHKCIAAKRFIDFFQYEKDKGSTLLFDYETDSNNKISRFFWVDPVSNMTYTL